MSWIFKANHNWLREVNFLSYSSAEKEIHAFTNPGILFKEEDKRKYEKVEGEIPG